MAREGQKQAVQLSSQVQDTAASVTRRTGDALQNGKETVNNKTNRVTNTASNVAGHTGDAVQRGKETVTDQANRNFGTSGTGNENTGLPQTNNNATTREIAATRSNLNETHQDGALEDTTFTGTPRELGSSSLGSYNDTSRVGSTIGHSGTDHTSSTRDGTRHGDKSQSYGVDSTSSIGSGSRTGANTYTISNSGLGTTSSVETPLETPGLLGDAAAARAYMSTTGGDEYTHTPDYGAIGGAYNGHNSVDTKSASKQADNTPRYDTIDGNHDSRFDTRGSVSTGTNSREYANATQGH